MPRTEYKRCKRCDERKPRDAFQVTTRNADGLDRWCKACRNARNAAYRLANRDRINQKRREDWADKPEQRRAEWRRRSIKRRYGLTVEEYEAHLDKGCAICGVSREEAEIHMDHCHETGEVREALCAPCNVALGGFRDDPKRLRAAAAYVEKHRG